MRYATLYEPSAFIISEELLKSGAVQLNVKNPFVWSSGLKSPIYCDNRVLLAYPSVRTCIKKYLTSAINTCFDRVEYIAGVATAGIPHGVLVADELSLPYVYVRAAAKEHGMCNRIEGKVEKGKRVVLVEDLISTGKSSLSAAKTLVEAGFVVVGLVAIFTYGFLIAEKNFETDSIPFSYLSNFDYLLDVAVKNKYVNEHQITHLKSWRLNPEKWQPRNS